MMVRPDPHERQDLLSVRQGYCGDPRNVFDDLGDLARRLEVETHPEIRQGFRGDLQRLLGLDGLYPLVLGPRSLQNRKEYPYPRRIHGHHRKHYEFHQFHGLTEGLCENQYDDHLGDLAYQTPEEPRPSVDFGVLQAEVREPAHQPFHRRGQAAGKPGETPDPVSMYASDQPREKPDDGAAEQARRNRPDRPGIRDRASDGDAGVRPDDRQAAEEKYEGDLVAQTRLPIQRVLESLSPPHQESEDRDHRHLLKKEYEKPRHHGGVILSGT